MEAIRQTIVRSYLSEGLSESQVEQLVSISEIKEFADGEEILSQFETDTDLMILLEGEGVVTSYLKEPIGSIKPYGVFGEVALFDQKSRSASITSKGVSRVVMIDGARLHGLMNEDKDLAIKIHRGVILVLCGRLRATTKALAAYIAIDDAF